MIDPRDPLDGAFTALREETDEEATAERVASSRRAVLTRAAAREGRRGLFLHWFVPAAAVLAGGAVFAAATGKLPFAGHEPPPIVATQDSVTPPVVQLPPATTAATAATAPPPPVTETASGAVVVRPAPSTSTSASASAAASDPEEALYRAAHELHFGTKDYGRAIAAWDAYLAAHPSGRFAPEARYNRALGLVREGRRDEARAALQPFADGSMGGYRQREARQLLDALD